MKKYNLAVIGVGAVGIEMLRLLRQRRFEVNRLKVFARSQRWIKIDRIKYKVEQISAQGFNGIDIGLFAGTEGEKGASATYAPEAVKRGVVVIDNGADFRMKPDVPLVVPEVNPQDIRKHKGIIASPNCSTIQMVVALWPIYKRVGIRRIVVSTFQAASGAGRGAVEQLYGELQGIVATGRSHQPVGQKPVTCDLGLRARVLPQQLAFNVFPHIGSFADFGYTSEEWKMIRETQKIFHDNRIKITATCVRVPVKTGHCEAIYFETKKEISTSQIKKMLINASGIKVIDNSKQGLYPMPKDAEGKDEVFVGRIRKDPFIKNGFWLWVVSDNLRKGAALNAIQIAEHLIKS
jgi:aspartate-semialdehyde dehydrogenase